MPRYSYECPVGHRHEVNRPVEERNDPLYCDHPELDGDFCNGDLRRRWDSPAISIEGRAYREDGFDANDWLASQ